MKNHSKKRRAVMICSLLLTMGGLTACNGSAGQTKTSEKTEDAVIVSKLKESYQAGEEVDLTPTIKEGWSYTITIRKGTTPMLSNSTKTSYTFNQTGSYTIVYTAKKGSETKTLSVEITITPKMGDSFLTFTGSNYQMIFYSGSICKIYSKETNEEVLSTEYQYTRSVPKSATNLVYTFAENEVGPVFYVAVPDKTDATTEMPVSARSVCTGNEYSIEYSYKNDTVDINDTFKLDKSTIDAKLSKNDAILTFNGEDGVFGPCALNLYDDGLCSINFLGTEVTAGRYGGNTNTVYGGGSDGNRYGGGFWSFSGTQDDPVLNLEIGKEKYVVTKDATNTLNFTYTYSITAYKRNMNMSSTASYWVPALLHEAATKVTFTGTNTELICNDDVEKTVTVNKINTDGSKKKIQEGNWDFNEVSRAFSITLKDSDGKSTSLKVTESEDGRLNVTYSNDAESIKDDLLETSLDWENVFPQAAKEVLSGSGNLTTLYMGDGTTGGGANPTDLTSRIVDDGLFTISIYDDHTYMIVGSTASSKGHTDTGTYVFKNNVYTFTSSRSDIGSFSTTYTDGTYSFTYNYPMRGYMNPLTISFKPEVVLTGTLDGRTFVLTTQADNRVEMVANMGDTAYAHTEVGSYQKNGNVYTFTFEKGGSFTFDGTTVTGSYKYTSAGQEYEVALTLPANQ